MSAYTSGLHFRHARSLSSDVRNLASDRNTVRNAWRAIQAPIQPKITIHRARARCGPKRLSWRAVPGPEMATQQTRALTWRLAAIRPPASTPSVPTQSYPYYAKAEKGLAKAKNSLRGGLSVGILRCCSVVSVKESSKLLRCQDVRSVRICQEMALAAVEKGLRPHAQVLVHETPLASRTREVCNGQG